MQSHYERFGKQYYQTHKAEINEYRRQGLNQEASERYYYGHQEEVKKKNLARYYLKKEFKRLAMMSTAVLC